jgi:hypothetical protein
MLLIKATMNFDHRTLLGLALVFPLALGCASRQAPFNDLDEAQTKVLRLQGQEAPAAAMPGATPGAPLIPGLPGIPPELQALGQQAAQAANQVLPGLIPPGLIPGATPAAPAAVAPPAPRFPGSVPGQGYVILGERFLASDGTDKDTQQELLDLFGDEDNYTEQPSQCFVPGLGVSFNRTNGPPVELLVSIQCRAVQGAGFSWPHAGKGTFTSDALQKVTKIYQQLWGPVPPGA